MMQVASTKPVIWTAVDAAAATGGRSRRTWEAKGVSIDTRLLEQDDLFVALEGDNRDGHNFVADALQRGAAAALVSRVPVGVSEEAPLLIAEDTMLALERLGAFSRDRCRAKRIAVTGSVGKTGTKEALRAALATMGKTHASAASYNNHWGVPLTLARMPVDTEFGVFEVGMNHAREIANLSPQIAPEIGIITTIAAAHLAFFNSTEDIARAKAEIFQGMAAGATAILHGDAPHAETLEQLAQDAGLVVVTFGQSERCDCRLLEVSRSTQGSAVSASYAGDIYRYKLAAKGVHHAENSLATLLSLLTLGLDPEPAMRPLAELRAGAGRGGHRTISVPGGSVELIDESYNANPRSMAAAIAVLGEAPGRRVAILGDMLELGSSAPALHADLAGNLEKSDVSLVLTCGPLMAALHQALPELRRGPHFRDSSALAAALPELIHADDQVLVKGSLGSRMAAIVEALDTLAREPQGSAA